MKSLIVPLQMLGERQKVILAYEDLLTIARLTNARKKESSFLGKLASVYEGLGDIHQAVSLYEQSARIWRELGERQYEALISETLARLHERQGDTTRAALYLRIWIDYLRSDGTDNELIPDMNSELNKLDR